MSPDAKPEPAVVPPVAERRPDERLEALIDAVKADAEHAPLTYARDTVVPEGGE